MNDRLNIVLADLDAEGAQLESWVAPLEAELWATSTPAEGWTIAHQIAHLLWTDEVAVMAITSPEGFGALLKQAAQDPAGFVDAEAERLAALPSDELLFRWRASRTALAEALRGVPEGSKIAWFGPPMSATSMATARLMETWAHSLDVAGALGIESPQTSRAKHVAYLGVRTRAFAYMIRGEQAPDEEVRVELTGPDGDVWAWGPEDAAQRVTGNGYDFALLATRRRHLEDVDVKATGDDAAYWLTIIQAFAGQPGPEPLRLIERGLSER
ncbi:MAG: TIGR03084 family protein [Propionibacteriales bacterium]|nr:TIGR03084 family protein [Propionibacteriales bacterium]